MLLHYHINLRQGNNLSIWFMPRQNVYCVKNIVTYWEVVWPTKHVFRNGNWIYSLRFQVTTNYNHMEQFLQQHLDQLLQHLLLSTGSSLNSSGTNWINSSSRSNQTARLLNSNSNCLLWAGTWSAFKLPLDFWTASHASVELLFTVLSNSVLLFCRTPS
jgi:hypothetical protein